MNGKIEKHELNLDNKNCSTYNHIKIRMTKLINIILTICITAVKTNKKL